MILLAIYSEVFSETEPVRHERKIFDVPSSVLMREKIDSACLGS